MQKRKRRGLEAGGWRVGTVTEFLALSDEEAALVELRLKLSSALRTRRIRLHVSQTVLAKRLRSSQSRVAKMEAADPTVSLDLIVRGLLALGATPRDLAKAIQAGKPSVAA
jgi:hypothetical protein